MVKQTELHQHVSVWRRIVESKLYFLNDNPDRPRQFCKLAVHQMQMFYTFACFTFTLKVREAIRGFLCGLS